VQGLTLGYSGKEALIGADSTGLIWLSSNGSNITVDGEQVKNASDPTEAQDLATKNYTDIKAAADYHSLGAVGAGTVDLSSYVASDGATFFLTASGDITFDGTKMPDVPSGTAPSIIVRYRNTDTASHSISYTGSGLTAAYFAYVDNDPSGEINLAFTWLPEDSTWYALTSWIDDPKNSFQLYNAGAQQSWNSSLQINYGSLELSGTGSTNGSITGGTDTWPTNLHGLVVTNASNTNQQAFFGVDRATGHNFIASTVGIVDLQDESVVGIQQFGIADTEIVGIQSKFFEIDGRTTTLTYTDGQLTGVVEKSGTTTIYSATLTYTDGVLTQSSETAADVTVTSTLSYTGSQLTSITRSAA
jgi:hypothetical protein